KPDMYSEISNYLQNKIDSEENLILDRAGKTYICFTNNKLDNHIPTVGKDWTSTHRIFLFELQNRDEKLMLKAIIGPGEQEVRNKIYNIAQNNKQVFKRGSKKLFPSFTTVHSREILRKKYAEFYETIDDINKKI